MEKYELVRDIGSGNFGVVRLMRNKETKELVAMKYIPRGQKIDENVVREIINHRSLRHPNIIHIKEVNEEASDKVLEVEQKYKEIRGPVYKMRNEIIKSIPDFWFTAFLSHPALCDLVTEEDQKMFKYLDSLLVEDFKDLKSGYSITFRFSPNPYFEDTSLKKTYSFFDNGITNIAGTAIRWKEEMNAANGVAHEKNGNKRPFPEERPLRGFDVLKDKDTGNSKGLHSTVTVMEVLMTLQGSQMETDDPITSYMLQSAQLKPDVTITSVDLDEDMEELDDERHASSLENKRVDLFDGLGGGDGISDENAMLASNPEEMRRCQEEMRAQGVPSLSNLLLGRRN